MVSSERKSEQLNEQCFPLSKLWVGDLALLVLLDLGVSFLNHRLGCWSLAVQS